MQARYLIGIIPALEPPPNPFGLVRLHDNDPIFGTDPASITVNRPGNGDIAGAVSGF